MNANPSRTLEALIARVALGDRQAFSDLFDATSAKLLAVCLRVLGERALAEDAMQEAYIKVWRYAERYRVSGHSPMTWLITIARNTAIDRLRAKKPEDDIADFENQLTMRAPTPEEATLAASQIAEVKRCLAELDEDRRAAIAGAYLGGESYKALAARFDVPLNTMRTWLRRGLMALRECIAR